MTARSRGQNSHVLRNTDAELDLPIDFCQTPVWIMELCSTTSGQVAPCWRKNQKPCRAT